MLYICSTEGETTRFPLFYAPKMPKTTSKVVKTRSDVVKITSDVVFTKSDVVIFSSEFGAKIDTVADLAFVTVSLIKILPVIHMPVWLWIWGGVIALL